MYVAHRHRKCGPSFPLGWGAFSLRGPLICGDYGAVLNHEEPEVSRSAMGWVIHNGGDIKFEAENIAAALAFIKGVEKTFEAFTGSEAP